MAIIEVKVPQLPESVSEATLMSWHKRVGQAVEEYYGFVIRRLAEQGELPKGFSAPIPPPPGPRVRTAGER